MRALFLFICLTIKASTVTGVLMPLSHSSIRSCLVLLSLLIAALALSQPVPTYAWRRTFNDLNSEDKVANLVTDVSGNVYMEYASNGPSIACHLAKISP